MDTEGFYQATLESLPEAVIATDAQGHVRYLNVSAKRLLGVSLNEARGRPFGEVVMLRDGASGAAVSSPLTRLLGRSEHEGDKNRRDRVIQPGGNEIAVDDSAALIRGQAGEVLGMVFTLRTALRHGS
jgi:PAS domain S-box-containing protein